VASASAISSWQTTRLLRYLKRVTSRFYIVHDMYSFLSEYTASRSARRQRGDRNALQRSGRSSRHLPHPQVPISVSDRPTPRDCTGFQTASRPSSAKGGEPATTPSPAPDLVAPIVLQHPHSFVGSDFSGELGGFDCLLICEL
jgi:hypothetical protein